MRQRRFTFLTYFHALAAQTCSRRCSHFLLTPLRPAQFGVWEVNPLLSAPSSASWVLRGLWSIALTASIWLYPTENLAEGLIIPPDKPNSTCFCICPSKQSMDHVCKNKHKHRVSLHMKSPLFQHFFIFYFFCFCLFLPAGLFPVCFGAAIPVSCGSIYKSFAQCLVALGDSLLETEKHQNTQDIDAICRCEKKKSSLYWSCCFWLSLQVSAVVVGFQISFLIQYWTKPTPMFQLFISMLTNSLFNVPDAAGRMLVRNIYPILLQVLAQKSSEIRH